MTMPERERRRRRPAVSCTLCRRRKIKCNRETPCSNCVRSKSETCVYEKQPGQGPRQAPTYGEAINLSFGKRPLQPESAFSNSSSLRTNPTDGSESPEVGAISSLAGTTSACESDVLSLKLKIRQLEEQLSTVTSRSGPHSAPVSNHSIVTTTSQIAGTFHITHENQPGDQGQAIPCNIIHKSRVFGQSHWSYGATLFRDLFKMIEPHVQGEKSKAPSALQRCKALARVIKAQRAPPWPVPKMSDLPPKATADELVDHYLQTSEKVYRVLHVPSFRADYEALWVSGNEPDPAFLVLLKLVLAIGAASRDEKFSMRSSAVKWVHEALTWFSNPDYKRRLNIQGLQINILILISQESVAVGADMTWVSAGALLRVAMHMGLHRDPSRLQKQTILAAEMRRRLWNTILEIVLQSSMGAGAPAMISPDDFNTEPPGNLNDDELCTQDPVPRPDVIFTQVSIALLLRRTLPHRLAIVKALNNLHPGAPYEETLRLDADLRSSYRAICRILRQYKLNSGPVPSQFELRFVDLLIHRFLSSLHMPYFAPFLDEARYAFSRKVVVESSLKMWYAAFQSPSAMAGNTNTSERDYIACALTSSPSFCGRSVLQAVIFIAVELRARIQEEEYMGPSPYHRELLSIVRDAKDWTWKCIEAGETNVKSYLFACLIVAQIEALMDGLKTQDIPMLVVKAIEEGAERCLAPLERQATEGCQGQTSGDLNLEMPSIPMEDWGFIMSDTPLDFGSADPINWVFSEEELSFPG